eukprot:scaffold564172_cov19-Prasinocladus_malaysianus.AAC.1
MDARGAVAAAFISYINGISLFIIILALTMASNGNLVNVIHTYILLSTGPGCYISQVTENQQMVST